MNAAGNHYGAAIMPESGGTLSKVRLRINSTAGTLGASDLECALYATASGIPTGSAIETKTSTTSGASIVEWTGFSSTLNARTLYWFTVRNTNGTPGTNTATVFRPNGPIGLGTAAGTPAWGDLFDATSTNSGSSWSTSNTIPALEIEFSGGHVEGLMIQSQNASGIQVYSGRESGIAWTVPPNGPAIRVIGITSSISMSGSPTSAVRYRLYAGPASAPVLLGTTSTLTATQLPNNSTVFKTLYFPSIITVQPGNVVTAVVSEDGSGSTSSTNRFQMQLWTIANGANWGYSGNPTYRLSTDGGATFSTETTDRIAPIALVLDEQRPYAGPVSGGFAITQ